MNSNQAIVTVFDEIIEYASKNHILIEYTFCPALGGMIYSLRGKNYSILRFYSDGRVNIQMSTPDTKFLLGSFLTDQQMRHCVNKMLDLFESQKRASCNDMTIQNKIEQIKRIGNIQGTIAERAYMQYTPKAR